MCHHRTPTQRAAGSRSLSRRSAPAIGGTRPIWSKRSRYIPGSVRAAVATAAAKSFVSFMVHHRDHNDDNNPSDGSNWELLCLYCHENQHARYQIAGPC